MKIVAFLQNCWFPPGTSLYHIRRYLINDDFRRKVLKKGWSGKRLMNAFGEELFDKIIWDNASLEVGATPGHRADADRNHIANVIYNHSPDLILTFGTVARDAVRIVNRTCGDGACVLSTKHPNARGFTNEELSHFVKQVKEWINE